ncbi:hypothetical protein PN36_34195 [Candidatus Thiomargarita nelsonii]|uniref:Uncharacterized protein n=1 Tax=Candidatus Thiomargarita nelsonii TaxID=1003181 RepID=A0A0A6P5U9_9GAMM|nr:hypothetical protein PN36_34195 [Candidatus Thiomargarita nelsonii]
MERSGFPETGKLSVVSGMERSGFPETGKLSVVSGMERSGFPPVGILKSAKLNPVETGDQQ